MAELHPGARDDGVPPIRAGHDPSPDTVAELWLATFAPRTDLYNRWTGTGWVIPQDHVAGCHTRPCDCPHSPLTVPVVLDTVRDRGAIGAYTPCTDGTTWVAALDVDRDDDGVDAAARIVRVLADAGVPAYREPSQLRRMHVWIVGPKLPAIAWRYALLAACTAAGFPAATDGELHRVHHIEVRPEDKSGIGSALRLPGMWHPKTGQRYPLIAPDGAVLGDRPREWLPALDDAPADALVALAEAHRPPAPAAPPPANPRARDWDRQVGVSDVLRELWGLPGERALPGRTVKCPIHDDRRASLSIARDDRRVWCHGASCPANNNGKGVSASELAALRGAA